MIMIQFVGKFRYFLSDIENITIVLDSFMSVFRDAWYIGYWSIIINNKLTIRNIMIVIVNLFEYINFSFDATLVI